MKKVKGRKKVNQDVTKDLDHDKAVAAVYQMDKETLEVQRTLLSSRNEYVSATFATLLMCKTLHKLKHMATNLSSMFEYVHTLKVQKELNLYVEDMYVDPNGAREVLKWLDENTQILNQAPPELCKWYLDQFTTTIMNGVKEGKDIEYPEFIYQNMTENDQILLGTRIPLLINEVDDLIVFVIQPYSKEGTIKLVQWRHNVIQDLDQLFLENNFDSKEVCFIEPSAKDLREAINALNNRYEQKIQQHCLKSGSSSLPLYLVFNATIKYSRFYDIIHKVLNCISGTHEYCNLMNGFVNSDSTGNFRLRELFERKQEWVDLGDLDPPLSRYLKLKKLEKRNLQKNCIDNKIHYYPQSLTEGKVGMKSKSGEQMLPTFPIIVKMTEPEVKENPNSDINLVMSTEVKLLKQLVDSPLFCCSDNCHECVECICQEQISELTLNSSSGRKVLPLSEKLNQNDVSGDQVQQITFFKDEKTEDTYSIHSWTGENGPNHGDQEKRPKIGEFGFLHVANYVDMVDVVAYEKHGLGKDHYLTVADVFTTIQNRAFGKKYGQGNDQTFFNVGCHSTMCIDEYNIFIPLLPKKPTIKVNKSLRTCKIPNSMILPEIRIEHIILAFHNLHTGFNHFISSLMLDRLHSIEFAHWINIRLAQLKECCKSPQGLRYPTKEGLGTSLLERLLLVEEGFPRKHEVGNSVDKYYDKTALLIDIFLRHIVASVAETELFILPPEKPTTPKKIKKTNCQQETCILCLSQPPNFATEILSCGCKYMCEACLDKQKATYNNKIVCHMCLKVFNYINCDA